MKCPCCNKQVTPDHFSCHSGSIGGRKTGPTKARSPEAVRKAVEASLAARKAKREREK